MKPFDWKNNFMTVLDGGDCFLVNKDQLDKAELF